MAIRTAESTFGARGVPLRLETDELIHGGVMFHATVPDFEGREPDRTLTRVAENQQRFAALGAFLFVVQHGSPATSGESGGVMLQTSGRPDLVALLPTTDQFEVVRRVGTNGNSRHTADEVLAWLRALDRAEPYVLLGAGLDFVEGYFVNSVRDPAGLAQNVYAFCPDFWDQGIGLLNTSSSAQDGIADYFRTERYFYFWWD